MERLPVDILTLQRNKQRGEKITILTAYDAAWARLLDQAGVESFSSATAPPTWSSATGTRRRFGIGAGSGVDG